MKKVFEVNTKTMWNYMYQAQKTMGKHEILASDSLLNLKKAIRERRWMLAWLSMTKGCFSYGQNLVNTYPYQPRY